MKKPEDRLYRDKRGQLVLHFIRLVKELKPKVFVMENVPQILELRNAIEREFRKIGVYRIYFNILKAQNYGNPSKRTRVFISNVPIDEKPAKRYVKVADALRDLPPLNTIPNHEEVRISKSKLEKIAMLRWGESLVKFGGRFENWLRLHPYKLAPTVMGHSRFVHPFEDRLLTVREQARLMGFPDDHVFLGGRNVQFDMVGEAVPVPLARAVAKEVKLKLSD
jgi:DNA (cytosine-5)-methyltransferase 1